MLGPFPGRASELVGAEPGSVQVMAVGDGRGRVEFRGNLTASSVPEGPFSPENGESPLTVASAVAGATRDYRAEGKPIVSFQDDFEAATPSWNTSGTGPAWERGTLGYADEITENDRGSAVWTPACPRHPDPTTARFSFHDMLDNGGKGDGDQAEVHVCGENGGVAGAEAALGKGSRNSSGPCFFQRRIVHRPGWRPGKGSRWSSGCEATSMEMESAKEGC